MKCSFSPLALLLALAVPVFGPGCVVAYGDAVSVGPAAPLPPPADFDEVQQRLEAMAGVEQEVDKRDRLDAALDMLRSARVMGADSQKQILRYLQQIVAIEERGVPIESPSLFSEALPETTATFTPMGGGVVEEDLGGVEELGTSQPETGTTLDEDVDPDLPPEPDVDAILDKAAAVTGQTGTAGVGAQGATDPVTMAQAALAAGDPAGALAALEPCGVVSCTEDADGLKVTARDAWIHAERERAGALFVRARSEPDTTERAARLVEARQILAGLVDRFPDSDQSDAIRRNIELVQTELDAVR